MKKKKWLELNHFFTNLYKIFTNLIIRANRPLNNQHRIAVGTKTILLFKSLLVSLHNLLISAEGCYRHKHGGAGQMEVGNDGCGDAETVGREDELVRPAVVSLDLVVGGNISLETADDGCANGKYLVTVGLGLVDKVCGLLGDNQALGVHLVLGEVLYIYLAEVSESHVHGNEGFVYVLENHAVKELAAEVKTGCGGGYGALMLCKDSLEVLFVLRGGLLFDKPQDRGFSKAVECLFELLVRAVEQEPEGAAAGGGVVDNLRYKALVLSEVKLVADTDLAGGVYDNIPQPLLAGELAEQEDLNVGSGFFLLAIKACGEYFGVVENEGVSLSEVVYDVLENFMLYFSCVLMKYHKAAFVAPSCRLGGNPFCREIEVELR